MKPGSYGRPWGSLIDAVSDFENQLGGFPVNEPVGQAENLIYKGVLSGPTSQDYMDLRLGRACATADGVTFSSEIVCPAGPAANDRITLVFSASIPIALLIEVKIGYQDHQPSVHRRQCLFPDCSALVREPSR